MASSVAVKIVSEVIDEITNRKGLRHQWDNVDVEVQDEIQATMADRIDAVLKAALGL